MNAGEIRIVRATPADRETVVALVERLLEELEVRPEDFAGLDRARVLREIEASGGVFTAFLARGPGGHAVGVVTVVEAFAIYAGGRYGVIDEMYVVPECRAKGVGRRLIEAAKELGRERGWLRLDVTAPPEKRWEGTVTFYEKQGFVFTGPKLRYRLG